MSERKTAASGTLTTVSEKNANSNIVPLRAPGSAISSHHHRILADSWIPPELAEAAGIRSVSSTDGAALLGRNDSSDYSGLAFPYYHPRTGNLRDYRLRRDRPEVEAGTGKLRGKYLAPPGRGNMLYFPGPGIMRATYLDDAALPLVVVEGEKKALALWRLAGDEPSFLPVGIPGVWNWRGTVGKAGGPNGERLNEKGPIADLDWVHWQGRKVTILFDTNVGTNESVRAARSALTAELHRRGASVHWVSWPGEVPERVNGIDDYLQLAGPEAAEELLRTAERQYARTTTASAPEQERQWPQPMPLEGDLPPVLPLSPDILPDALRALAVDISERMQVPLDYPSAALVLCLAGVVNRRAVVQPKANDTRWQVVPNLWGGIVAPPGLLKSPVIAEAIRPLRQIETQWRHHHEQQIQEHAFRLEEHELQRTAWKEQYKTSIKKRQAAPDRPANDLPVEPRQKRLIVNDSTFEALHQTMAENSAGVLVIRDELTGWWSQLDRSGREGERAFCLQAWNGDTGHTIDRIGRGTIHVEACCMSMLGGIQPGRLRSYLADALRDGPSNDGLIQRFQVLVWPDTMPGWRYIDRPADYTAEEQLARVFGALADLDPENPLRFRFDDGAQALFIAWLADLETRVRDDHEHPAFVSHMAKYRSLMPSLALLFELADLGFEGFEGSQVAQIQKIRLPNAKRAAAWCDYLLSHARRIYACIVTSQLRAACDLASRIKTRKIGTDGSFTARDVYFKGWSGLDSPDAVRAAAEILIDAHWLRIFETTPGKAGGRPSQQYLINPEVLK